MKIEPNDNAVVIALFLAIAAAAWAISYAAVNSTPRNIEAHTKCIIHALKP